jgi:hypothetical protein
MKGGYQQGFPIVEPHPHLDRSFFLEKAYKL